MSENKNVDKKVVSGFGDEWSRFDQSALEEDERGNIFHSYFAIFPWDKIDSSSEGFDMGCGSGRWAEVVAAKVGQLNCIDPSSEALGVAKNKLRNFSNCSFFNESVDSLPFPDNSQDFGYSLGVIHHIPDMQEAINCCVKKLKTGAPFLIYCYYSFDNRPFWYRWLWLITNFFRVIISRTPSKIRYLLSQAFALCVYLPIAKSIKLLKKMGFDLQTLPLYFYHDKSFYTMRTDALDRFGTRLEHRLSRLELENLMKFAGLENITFSEHAPFWCAIGYKRCTEHI